MLQHITIICGDLTKIDERVAHLLHLSLEMKEDVTLVRHPAASCRASEQVSLFKKILHEAELDQDLTHLITATNSESIINYLGEMVENHQLDRTSIVVELIDHREHCVSQFDAQGVLFNWPIGYLAGWTE
jgi:hypothetical protein